MELSASKIEGISLISMVGDFDISTDDEVSSMIEDIITSGEKNLILDFEKTDFIDSTAIGIIVDTTKRLRKVCGDLILLKVNENIKGLFRIADLLHILSFAESKPHALGMLNI